jgi:molybdopterin converting factor small subunit
MRIKLFAALREIAGAAVLEVDAPDVAVLCDELSTRFGERFGRILMAGAVVVNGEPAGPAQRLAPEDQVALLPPVSGG